MDLQEDYIRHLEKILASLRGKAPARIHLAKSEGFLQNLPKMHFHPFGEVFIQLCGRRRFTCPHETFELGEGELCILPALLPHRELAFNGDKAPFLGLVFYAEREKCSIHRSGISEDGTKPTVAHSVPLPEADIKKLSQLTELASESPEPEVRIGLVYALLSLLVSSLRQHRENTGGEPARAAAKIVQNAQGIIFAYLSDASLSIARIAREVGCSADHLSRCFQQELGIGAQAYLQGERLALSKRLLQRPNMRICEVAWSCGFDSANYFIRLFRQQTGVTPKQYRNAKFAG